jgi:hypothetical protein
MVNDRASRNPRRRLGICKSARRDLNLQQRHSLQRSRISLALLGSAKNGFSEGFHVGGADCAGMDAADLNAASISADA